MIVVLMISIISFRPDDQIEIKMPPAYTDLYASGTQTANYCREDECFRTLRKYWQGLLGHSFMTIN